MAIGELFSKGREVTTTVLTRYEADISAHKAKLHSLDSAQRKQAERQIKRLEQENASIRQQNANMAKTATAVMAVGAALELLPMLYETASRAARGVLEVTEQWRDKNYDVAAGLSAIRHENQMLLNAMARASGGTALQVEQPQTADEFAAQLQRSAIKNKAWQKRARDLVALGYNEINAYQRARQEDLNGLLDQDGKLKKKGGGGAGVGAAAYVSPISDAELAAWRQDRATMAGGVGAPSGLGIPGTSEEEIILASAAAGTAGGFGEKRKHAEFKETPETFKYLAENVLQAREALSMFRDSAASAFEAWITGAKSFKEAARDMIGGMLVAKASGLAGTAAEEGVLALVSLARMDYPGAALHGKAAGAAAAGAALLGALAAAMGAGSAPGAGAGVGGAYGALASGAGTGPTTTNTTIFVGDSWTRDSNRRQAARIKGLLEGDGTVVAA